MVEHFHFADHGKLEDFVFDFFDPACFVRLDDEVFHRILDSEVDLVIFYFCCLCCFHFRDIFIWRYAIDFRIVWFWLDRRFENPRVIYFERVDLL